VSLATSGYLIQLGVNVPNGIGQIGKARLIPARPLIALVAEGVCDGLFNSGTLVSSETFMWKVILSIAVAFGAGRSALSTRNLDNGKG